MSTNLKQTQEETMDYSESMKEAVKVEFIDTNLYMGKNLWKPTGGRGGYGGQVIAQALNAAWSTVPEDFYVHSLHSYFILASNVDIPVLYTVQRIREGKSFATRIVKATQRGKVIFVCSFSFTKPDNSICLNHQTEMPIVAGPDSLPTEVDALEEAFKKGKHIPNELKARARMIFSQVEPVEYRNTAPGSPEELLTGTLEPTPYQSRWFKSKGKLNDDPKLHTLVLAYASDKDLLNTAARANGLTYKSVKVGMMTSLDHSIWFHAPARADEWLFYEMHSPRSNDGRGVAFGRIYSQDGTLLATVAQEGVVRYSPAIQESLQQAEIELKQELSNNLNKL